MRDRPPPGVYRPSVTSSPGRPARTLFRGVRTVAGVLLAMVLTWCVMAALAALYTGVVMGR